MVLWVIMNQEAAVKLHVEKLKRIVIGGGGIWVGVQETIPPLHDLVMFKSEYSGSVLCLPDDEFFTVNAVHEHILKSDGTFKKGKKKMRTFQIYSGNIPQGDPIKAQQISTEAGGVVGFYASAVDGNSRKLLSVAYLAPGQSVREVSE
jgi:hypothetical protein